MEELGWLVFGAHTACYKFFYLEALIVVGQSKGGHPSVPGDPCHLGTKDPKVFEGIQCVVLSHQRQTVG